MACEIKTKVIGKDTWTVMQMPATQALALETRLAPVLLQGVVPMLSALGASEEEQSAVLSQGITSMMSSMPAEELASIIVDLCSQTMKNGERIVFETEFSGGAGVMLRYQVAWFVLSANFADFFAALLPEGVMNRARAKFDETMGTGESTGESGDPVSRSLPSAA